MKFIKEFSNNKGNYFLLGNNDKTYIVAQCISIFNSDNVYDTFEDYETAESYYKYITSK